MPRKYRHIKDDEKELIEYKTGNRPLFYKTRNRPLFYPVLLKI